MANKLCPFCKDKIEKFQKTVERHEGCAGIASPAIGQFKFHKKHGDDPGDDPGEGVKCIDYVSARCDGVELTIDTGDTVLNFLLSELRFFSFSVAKV